MTGGLLHLVQRGGAWASCGPAQSSPRCAKCNSPPINGQCTVYQLYIIRCGTMHVKGLMHAFKEFVVNLPSAMLCISKNALFLKFAAFADTFAFCSKPRKSTFRSNCTNTSTLETFPLLIIVVCYPSPCSYYRRKCTVSIARHGTCASVRPHMVRPIYV